MHKRLVALPGRQAAEHRRGGGREMVSISWLWGGEKAGRSVTHNRRKTSREKDQHQDRLLRSKQGLPTRARLHCGLMLQSAPPSGAPCVAGMRHG